MSLHDMIQPSFTFLVGVALPYSLRSRQRKGESFRRMLAHTMFRSLVLIALGIFLRSTYSPMTNYTFEDTLTQIGLGYTFAFLLTFVRPRWQWIAFGGILFGYWLAWALYPAPGANFDLGCRGRACGLASASLHGIRGALEQEQQSRPGFRCVVLNVLPRPSRFLYNSGGYLTLSFIPTLGTCCWALRRGGGSRSRHRRFHCGSSRLRRWRCVPAAAAALHGSLPDCEAHLDAGMDAVERRRLLPFSGCVFLGHRCAGNIAGSRFLWWWWG